MLQQKSDDRKGFKRFMKNQAEQLEENRKTLVRNMDFLNKNPHEEMIIEMPRTGSGPSYTLFLTTDGGIFQGPKGENKTHFSWERMFAVLKNPNSVISATLTP